MADRARHAGTHQSSPTYLRCPWCGESGPAQPVVSQSQDFYLYLGDESIKVRAGQRICPNPACHGHMFVLQGVPESSGKIETYPRARVSYERDKVPSKVADAFDEAVECYSNGCYMAAGVMIRKTVEEICNLLGARTGMLGQRLAHLKTQPHRQADLIDLMSELNYLGTDSAHVELRHFNGINEAEIEAGIEAVKVLIRDLYQFDTAIKKLRALKSP